MRTSEYLHPLLLYKTIIRNAVDKIYLCKKHENRTAKQKNKITKYQWKILQSGKKCKI